MSIFKTKRLATITVVYWFVLLYIIAALVYWFISLQHQNIRMSDLLLNELKPPIAVTRLNLETMQKRRLEEQQQQKLINITLQEVNRLNSLCNNILLASQLDAGEYKISKNEINLSELAKRVFNDFRTRYQARELQGRFED